MLNAELLMFRQLSRHPVIVEGRNYHHSTRLDEAVLTSRVTSFYNIWWPGTSTNRVFFFFLILTCRNYFGISAFRHVFISTFRHWPVEFRQATLFVTQ